MKRFLPAFIILFCSISSYAQKLRSIKIKEPVICYAQENNAPHYIAPPEEYLQRIKHPGARTNSASIEVDYIGFESVPQAQQAFQRAVDIWADLLETSVPIRIEARWRVLPNGVLGSAIYTSAYANFRGAQKLNIFYPVAIAEKITGQELNDEEPDIIANFNSGINWHFDPDTAPTGTKYDLTTVVLHEIAHGLGFSGTFSATGNNGQFGLLGSGVPIIYDIPVEGGTGSNLIETVTSPSSAMATQLVSGNIFFDAPSARVKLYAPSPFDRGSSISHIDEATYSSTDNALMTPQIGIQEQLLDPGIALGMLKDLGWETVKINHHILSGSENTSGPYTATATIDADNGYNDATVKLNYTTDGTNFTSVTMTPAGPSHTFTGQIPGNGVARLYGYYISVNNTSGTEYVTPGKIVTPRRTQIQNIYVFGTGPDREVPQIIHRKELSVMNSKTELPIEAYISDNTGSVTAVLKYFINSLPQPDKTFTLTAPEDDSIYTATINFGSLANGDQIRYKIVATDHAVNPNTVSSPATGYHTVSIIGLEPTLDSYKNDFESPGRDAEFFGIGFSVAQPTGFSNRAIHSEHPYISGEGFLNGERELICQLRSPIRLRAADATLKFNEIALVEPGAEGSVFGDPDFYDYVIVEGSKDGGDTWEFLLAGYDARNYEDWLTRYNSSINSNGNSTASGIPTLYKPRTIDLLETFEEDDVVLIRFRMYIDQLSSGWGWAINNVVIQDVVTSIENPLESAVSVHPNPAKEAITVEAGGQSSPYFTIHLLNMQGKKVYESTEFAANGKMTHTIPSREFPSGMYLVKIFNGGKSVVRKIIKID